MSTAVVTCHECHHPINEHLSTESAGEDGGGLNGCENVTPGRVDEEFCRCMLTPNDIAAAAARPAHPQTIDALAQGLMDYLAHEFDRSWLLNPERRSIARGVYREDVVKYLVPRLWEAEEA